MANVTFLIGNGFDLNIGLKTSYSDFYKKYAKDTLNDNDLIKKFKKEIKKGQEQLWKDFEYGMGQSEYFENEQEFILCFRNFVVKFNEYIKTECENIDWDKTSQQCREFETSILNFYKYLTKIQENEIKKFIIDSRGNYTIKADFLQFNYTDAFDKLLNVISTSRRALYGINEHLHGTIDGYLTIGVNDISQIRKDIIKNNSDIQQIFIKPEYLNSQKENINEKLPKERALDVINSSDMFCAFGTSIGETDKYWWEKIADRLKNSPNTYFIIFNKCDNLLKEEKIDPVAKLENDKIKTATRDEIIKRFISLSGLDDEWLTNGRIIVELNNNKMFNFKLPLKTSNKAEESTLQNSL